MVKGKKIDIAKVIGENLAKVMEDHDISVRELAIKCDTSTAQIYRMLKGYDDRYAMDVKRDVQLGTLLNTLYVINEMLKKDDEPLITLDQMVKGVPPYGVKR